MFTRGLLLFSLALGALAGCAAEPPLRENPASLTRRAARDPAATLSLMRQQNEKLAGTPFLPGNRASLLIDGPQSFAALARAIDGAKTRIDMESYEFDGRAGAQFAGLLIAAAHRGVQVHLIYDGWGGLTTPDAVFAALRQAGVQVLAFNPLRPNARVPMNLNDRDHRKLLCVDGAITITGGVNITHVYENPLHRVAPDPESSGWRDTDIRLEGPVTAQFEAAWMQTWRDQNGPALPPPPAAPAPAQDGVRAEEVSGAPTDHAPLIFRTLIADIALAQHSVHLTTGFFIPTPDMTNALVAAAARGVDVRLIVPGRNTSQTTVAAGRASYGPLLRAGVHIYEMQGRILHAKTAVIDGAWSIIGSSNLDWRSTVWNNEIAAVVISPDLGRQMEQVYARDAAASREITYAAWRRRGLWERAMELKADMVRDLL